MVRHPGSAHDGENQTFFGDERFPRDHGVEVVVLDGRERKALMEDLMAAAPELRHEDIGRRASSAAGQSPFAPRLGRRLRGRILEARQTVV